MDVTVTGFPHVIHDSSTYGLGGLSLCLNKQNSDVNHTIIKDLPKKTMVLRPLFSISSRMFSDMLM